jgi:predicted flap endonuclease-1-like 5' DNA nuclease
MQQISNAPQKWSQEMTFVVPEFQSRTASNWPFAMVMDLSVPDFPFAADSARMIEDLYGAQVKLAVSALDLWLLPISSFAGASAALKADKSPAVAAPAELAPPKSSAIEPVLDNPSAVAVASPPAVAPPATADISAEPSPPVAAAAVSAYDVEGVAPALFEKPVGRPDDLLKIKGIGPKLGQLLNSLGVWHYRQIAGWTPAEVAWVNAKIDFKGRIQREGWQAQATALMQPAQAA